MSAFAPRTSSEPDVASSPPAAAVPGQIAWQRPADAQAGEHRLRLLENGEEFFPAVFAAIETARHEVLLETFILFEDEVGLALQGVLADAARRGVRVDVVVDGYGSPEFSRQFIETLTQAGVHFHVFDPPPALSRSLQPLRRLHCKIVVVDAERGFIGGINYSADHLAAFGPEAKQDYAVCVKGPVVADMRRHALRLLGALEPDPQPLRPARSFDAAQSDRNEHGAQVRFVARDNRRHRDDIETEYRNALRGARREVIIANAYFFPGYRLLRALQRAAERGVKVRLILQGQPDMPWVAFATRLLYDRLLEAGVEIHEYCERPMHGKVAVVDDDWTTIGSSNLDPLSLSLNLEANLVIEDAGFNAIVRERLQHLLQHRCRQVGREQTLAPRWLWRFGVSSLVFHVMRHFARWAERLPRHRPQVVLAAKTTVVQAVSSYPQARPWPWRRSTQPPANEPRS